MTDKETYDPVAYSHKYDSYYNPDTGEWLEQKCSDPDCEFCADRPDNALEENVK